MTTTIERTALEELAHIAGKSPEEMQNALMAEAPAQGMTAELPGDDGYRCANFGTSLAGIDLDVSVCAKLENEGVSYKIEFRIFGHTVLSEGGTLTKDHEETRYLADYGAVSGTLTIGVNQWTSHFCPFVKWQGKVGLGPFSKDINFDHQFFCLR